jgi:hypothetical protein
MYSIIELQTNNGQTAHLYQTAVTQNEAMSKFHTVLASASISSVEIHTCVVMDEEGKYLARECYKHLSAEV